MQKKKKKVFNLLAHRSHFIILLYQVLMQFDLVLRGQAEEFQKQI